MRYFYQELTRRFWHTAGCGDKWPGDEKMIFGCLQRIADSLERIADLIDPAGRQEALRRQQQLQQFIESEERIRELSKWAKDTLFPFTVTGGERQSLNAFAAHIAQRMEREGMDRTRINWRDEIDRYCGPRSQTARRNLNAIYGRYIASKQK